MSNVQYSVRNTHDALSMPVRLHYISHSKYEKDWASIVHSHDFTELAFIQSGKGFFSIENVRYPVTAGDIAIIPPNTRHTEFSSEETALEYYFLGLTCPFFSTYPDMQQQGSTPLSPVLPLGSETNSIRMIFLEIFKEIQHPQESYETMIYGLLLQLIAFLMRHTRWLTQGTQVPAPVAHVHEVAIPYLCTKIKLYIETHYAEKISLTELARYGCISKYHLIHEFSRYLHTSPIAYQLSCRTKAAQQLLASTEMRIIDIAASVGFSSASHFSQTFKHATGTSPSEYRLMLKGTGMPQKLVTSSSSPAR